MEELEEFIKLARFSLGASGGKFLEYSEFLREFKKDNPNRDFEREAWEAGYENGLDALSYYEDIFEINRNLVRRIDTAAHIASAIGGSRSKKKKPARRPANQQYRPQNYGNRQYSRAGPPPRQAPARSNVRFESRGISTGYKQQQNGKSQWPKASTSQRPTANGYNYQTSRQNGYSNSQRNDYDTYGRKNDYPDDRRSGYDNYSQRNDYSNDRENGYSNNRDSYNQGNDRDFYNQRNDYDAHNQRNGYNDYYDQPDRYNEEESYFEEPNRNYQTNYNDDFEDSYQRPKSNNYKEEDPHFEESYQQRPKSNNYKEEDSHFEEPKQSSQATYKEEDSHFEEPKQSSQATYKEEEDLYDAWLSSPQTTAVKGPVPSKPATIKEEPVSQASAPQQPTAVKDPVPSKPATIKEEPVSQASAPQQPTTSITNDVGPKYDDRLQEDVFAQIGNIIFELIQDLHKQAAQVVSRPGDKSFLKSDVLLATIKKHKLDSSFTLGKLRCFLALFFVDSFHLSSGGNNSLSIRAKSEAPKEPYRIACRLLSKKEIKQKTLHLNVDYLCQMLGADSKDNVLLVYLSPVAWKEDYANLLVELRHYASMIFLLKPLDFIFKSDRALYYEEESRKFYRCIVLSAGKDQDTVEIFLTDEFQKYNVKMKDLYYMPARFRKYQDMTFTLTIENQGQTDKLLALVGTLKKCAAKNYVMNIKIEKYKEAVDGVNVYAGQYMNIAKG